MDSMGENDIFTNSLFGLRHGSMKDIGWPLKSMVYDSHIDVHARVAATDLLDS